MDREWQEVSGLVKSNVEELVESVDRLGNTAIDSLGSVKERVGGAVFGTSAGSTVEASDEGSDRTDSLEQGRRSHENERLLSTSNAGEITTTSAATLGPESESTLEEHQQQLAAEAK